MTTPIESRVLARFQERTARSRYITNAIKLLTQGGEMPGETSPGNVIGQVLNQLGLALIELGYSSQGRKIRDLAPTIDPYIVPRGASQERTATKVDDLYNEVEAKRLELENRLKRIMGDSSSYAYATMWRDTSMGESEYMDANYSARNRQRAIRDLTNGLKVLAVAERAIEMLERTNP